MVLATAIIIRNALTNRQHYLPGISMSPEDLTEYSTGHPALLLVGSVGLLVGLVYFSIFCTFFIRKKNKGDEEQIQSKFIHITPRMTPTIFSSVINNMKRRLYNMSDNETPPEKGAEQNRGKLQFSVVYNHRRLTLTLTIHRAKDLTPHDITLTRSPYVAIRVLPDKTVLYRSTVKKESLNPFWDETFAFEGWPSGQLIYRTLYLKLFDHDKYGEDEAIGELYIPLEHMDLSNNIPTWKFIHPCKEHRGKLGEISVCLSYLPEMNKITINVIKARGLRKIDLSGADPYLKIWLLFGNKRIMKQKTSMQFNTLQPEYDQEFTFDVPKENLQGASLTVFVMDNRSGNLCMGRAIFGLLNTGPPEARHWNDMVGHPEDQITRWHFLKHNRTQVSDG